MSYLLLFDHYENKIMKNKIKEFIDTDAMSAVEICEIATATAHQRIAAMLSALSEVE